MPDKLNNTSRFYQRVLKIISTSNFPFLVGGSVALAQYTYMDRKAKDLDIFCKAGDYPKILNIISNEGIKTRILDERWLAKVTERKSTVDIIFSSPNYLHDVDDNWFKYAKDHQILGINVKVVAPEEILWTKSFVQDREHYEGADINHLILTQGKNMDWKRVLTKYNNHWEILFGILINFRYVYPSERGIVPKWIMEELISRLENQLTNPIPQDKICRGPMLSRTQYKIDISKYDFKVLF